MFFSFRFFFPYTEEIIAAHGGNGSESRTLVEHRYPTNCLTDFPQETLLAGSTYIEERASRERKSVENKCVCAAAAAAGLRKQITISE